MWRTPSFIHIDYLSISTLHNLEHFLSHHLQMICVEEEGSCFTDQDSLVNGWWIVQVTLEL